jgi:DNA-directed RNA polymerase subunit RPC12/RpoP
MYDNQNGKCAICKKDYQLGGSKGLFVDHDHETKEVRGLLCRKCNSAIGQLEECKEILIEAIRYLKLQV